MTSKRLKPSHHLQKSSGSQREIFSSLSFSAFAPFAPFALQHRPASFDVTASFFFFWRLNSRMWTVTFVLYCFFGGVCFIFFSKVTSPSECLFGFLTSGQWDSALPSHAGSFQQLQLKHLVISKYSNEFLFSPFLSRRGLSLSHLWFGKSFEEDRFAWQ